MKIVNAEGLILGRLASRIAKEALLGEEIAIVNCDKAIITGAKKKIYEKLKTMRERGTPAKGPFLPKTSARYVKRVITRMLPYKKPRGKEAASRVKCYKTAPEKLQGPMKTYKDIHLRNLKTPKYATVGEVCKLIGEKQNE